METTTVLSIRELSEAGAARRFAMQWAVNQGWTELNVGRVALVVTELGRNLALHTPNGGRLLLRPLSNGNHFGLEILSMDDGPGMENISRCLRDGYSSIGTSGIGLGTVERTSEVFAAHSQPGFGTVLLSEVWNDSRASSRSPWRCGAVSVPAPGEIVCGDQWHELRPRVDVIRVMIADGLGHGEFAAQASRLAVEVFTKNPGVDPAALLQMMHENLRSTRGAAVAVAQIDLGKGKLHYAGIGNIAGVILEEGRTTSLVSMNGTVGANCRNIRTFDHAFPRRASLIMASDGLKSQFSPGRYVGLSDRHPGVMAGVLYRDYLRGTDDATVVVLKEVA